MGPGPVSSSDSRGLGRILAYQPCGRLVVLVLVKDIWRIATARQGVADLTDRSLYAFVRRNEFSKADRVTRLHFRCC